MCLHYSKAITAKMKKKMGRKQRFQLWKVVTVSGNRLVSSYKYVRVNSGANWSDRSYRKLVKGEVCVYHGCHLYWSKRAAVGDARWHWANKVIPVWIDPKDVVAGGTFEGGAWSIVVMKYYIDEKDYEKAVGATQ